MRNNIKEKKLKEFGFLLAIGFPFLIGWFLPLISGHAFRTWTIWVAIPFLILSFFKPILLTYPYKFWMKLGHWLGWLNSGIILGIIFLLIVIPTSFIMKITGYDPLKKKIHKKHTYMEPKGSITSDLTKIF